MGIPIPPLKPLVGQYAFLRHMPGDVLACLQRGVDAFPPVSACVNPHLIGAQMAWVWDNLTTDAMARALAATLGETLSDSEVVAVRAALDGAIERMTTYPRWLNAEEATRMCRETLYAFRREAALTR
jgi:hypothetical protein